jgi:hypothetical protein
MWIDQTHSGRKVNQRSQAGAGTYAILVAVVVCAAATMVVVDSTQAPTDAPLVPIFPEGGAMYLEAQAQARAQAEQAQRDANTAKAGSETPGAVPATDQPGYDEAAAVSIYTR